MLLHFLVVRMYLYIFEQQLIIIRIALYTLPSYLLGGRSVMKSIIISYYSLLGRGNAYASLQGRQRLDFITQQRQQVLIQADTSVTFMRRSIRKEHQKGTFGANQGLKGYVRSHVSDQLTSDTVERSKVKGLGNQPISFVYSHTRWQLI